MIVPLYIIAVLPRVATFYNAAMLYTGATLYIVAISANIATLHEIDIMYKRYIMYTIDLYERKCK